MAMQYGAISGLWIGTANPDTAFENIPLYSGALYLKGDDVEDSPHTLYVYRITPGTTTGIWITVAGEGGGGSIVTISDVDPDDATGNHEDFWFNRNGSFWIYDTDGWEPITFDGQLNVQSNWDETDATEDSYIQNKPILSEVGEENVQSDWDETDDTLDTFIDNKPIIPEAPDHTASEHEYFSGEYGDLTNPPTIPEAGDVNVQSDWNITDVTDDAYIENKPTIPEAGDLNVQSNWDETDATDDAFILNKPTIPDAGIGEENVQSDWDITDVDSDALILNKPDLSDLHTESHTHVEADIDDLVHVHEHEYFSGDYEALTNKPTIPEAGELNVQSNWDEDSDDSDAHILNKPTIPENVQADWDEIDEDSDSFIENKPTIPDVGVGEENVQSDWTETDTTEDSFIQNKPTIPDAGIGEENVQSDWEATTGDALILNKPTIPEASDHNISDHDYFSGDYGDLDDLPDLSALHSDHEYFSGAYGDLTNPPTIPENVQSDWDITDVNSDAYILHKPTIPDAGQENVQSDWTELDTSSDAHILNKPTIPEPYELEDHDADHDARFSPLAHEHIESEISDLDHVHEHEYFSGEYDDLIGTPEDIGEENVKADWTETDTSSDAYIQNKPTIIDPDHIISEHTYFSGDYDDLTDKPDLSELHSDHEYFSGEYGDLINPPTIPEAGDLNVQSDWDATSGDALILNKPTILEEHEHEYFSGDYDDLDDLPALLPIPSGNGDYVLNVDGSDIEWERFTAAEGITDLAIDNRDADSIDITSSTGTNVTIPSASQTEAGLQSAADKVKLDDLDDQTGAEIKLAYEGEDDTNAFTDLEQAKLDSLPDAPTSEANYVLNIPASGDATWVAESIAVSGDSRITYEDSEPTSGLGTLPNTDTGEEGDLWIDYSESKIYILSISGVGEDAEYNWSPNVDLTFEYVDADRKLVLSDQNGEIGSYVLFAASDIVASDSNNPSSIPIASTDTLVGSSTLSARADHGHTLEVIPDEELTTLGNLSKIPIVGSFDDNEYTGNFITFSSLLDQFDLLGYASERGDGTLYIWSFKWNLNLIELILNSILDIIEFIPEPGQIVAIGNNPSYEDSIKLYRNRYLAAAYDNSEDLGDILTAGSGYFNSDGTVQEYICDRSVINIGSGLSSLETAISSGNLTDDDRILLQPRTDDTTSSETYSGEYLTYGSLSSTIRPDIVTTDDTDADVLESSSPHTLRFTGGVTVTPDEDDANDLTIDITGGSGDVLFDDNSPPAISDVSSLREMDDDTVAYGSHTHEGVQSTVSTRDPLRSDSGREGDTWWNTTDDGTLFVLETIEPDADDNDEYNWGELIIIDIPDDIPAVHIQTSGQIDTDDLDIEAGDFYLHTGNSLFGIPEQIRLYIDSSSYVSIPPLAGNSSSDNSNIDYIGAHSRSTSTVSMADVAAPVSHSHGEISLTITNNDIELRHEGGIVIAEVQLFNSVNLNIANIGASAFAGSTGRAAKVNHRHRGDIGRMANASDDTTSDDIGYGSDGQALGMISGTEVGWIDVSSIDFFTGTPDPVSGLDGDSGGSADSTVAKGTHRHQFDGYFSGTPSSIGTADDGSGANVARGTHVHALSVGTSETTLSNQDRFLMINTISTSGSLDYSEEYISYVNILSRLNNDLDNLVPTPSNDDNKVLTVNGTNYGWETPVTGVSLTGTAPVDIGSSPDDGDSTVSASKVDHRHRGRIGSLSRGSASNTALEYGTTNGQVLTTNGSTSVSWENPHIFSIHDDVTTRLPITAGLSTADRFVVSDEGETGEPNSFITYARLLTELESDLDLDADFSELGLRITDGDLKLNNGSAELDSLRILATPNTVLPEPITNSTLQTTIVGDSTLLAARANHTHTGATFDHNHSISDLSNVPSIGADGTVLTSTGSSTAWEEPVTGTSYTASSPVSISASNVIRLVTNGITSTHIAEDAVGASEINANAVGTSELNTGSSTGNTGNYLQRTSSGMEWANVAAGSIDVTSEDTLLSDEDRFLITNDSSTYTARFTRLDTLRSYFLTSSITPGDIGTDTTNINTLVGDSIFGARANHFHQVNYGETNDMYVGSDTDNNQGSTDEIARIDHRHTSNGITYSTTALFLGADSSDDGDDDTTSRGRPYTWY